MSAGPKHCKFPEPTASSRLYSKSCSLLFLQPRSVYLCTPKPTQRLATYPTPCAHACHLSTCCHITHASSSVSGGCGVPLGELSHSMCLNLLLTSLSLICARVSFFFFFALNFISELSSVPEFAADAAALLTALLTLLDPGRESSKRSRETARWPLCITRPSATCHCSGHSAPTNSSLCEILK